MSIALLLVVVSVATIAAVSASAAYYEDRQTSIDGYSLVGIHVVNVTLHASGYSTSTSGSVTDKWMTWWYVFPNNIEDAKTWTASHPYGMYAKGSFVNKIGIPTPWGAVGLGGGANTLSILF